jgi:hypothetical protein
MNGSVADRVVQRHRRGRAGSRETQTARRRGRARRRGLLRQPDTLERYLQKPRKPHHTFRGVYSGSEACGRPPHRFLREMKRFYDGHQIPCRQEPDRAITGDWFSMFWNTHTCHAWHKFKEHGGLDAIDGIHESHSIPASPCDQRGCKRAWPYHGAFTMLFGPCRSICRS